MNTGTPSDTPRVTPATGGPPCVGLREAARVSGVSVATVRRRREQLIELGATVQPSGWVIPIPALVGVGLLDRVSPPDTDSTSRGDTVHGTPSVSPPGIPVDIPSPEVEELRREVAELRRRAEVAEAVAAERQVTIDAQAMALRAIADRPYGEPSREPVAPTTAPEPSSPPPAPAAEPQGWRAWLRRHRP